MTATHLSTEFRVTHLDNGMRVLTSARPGDTVCAMLFVTAGSRYESRDNSGVAHMLEHLFFSGTALRPSLHAVASEIDSWGCRFNALTDQEYTAYYVHGAAEYAEPALELIADLIQNAVLPPEDIDRERKVVLAELRSRQDNQRQACRQLANLALYGDTPMGWDTVGFPDVLRRLDRDELMMFRQAMYHPARMIVSVAGPVSHDEIVGVVARTLGTMPESADPVVRPEPAAYQPPVNLAEVRDSRLAHLCLAGVGPAYDQPEHEMMAARMMNSIFGKSMSSRLFTSIREDKGLCYVIRSTMDPASDVGAFLTATSVGPDNVTRLVESVAAEMVRFAEEGPTQAEMAKANAIVKGTSALDREDATALARLSAFELMHRGFVRSRAERDALADLVSESDVVAAARRYLDPANLRCALVGPASAIDQLSSSGCLPSDTWRVER